MLGHGLCLIPLLNYCYNIDFGLFSDFVDGKRLSMIFDWWSWCLWVDRIRPTDSCSRAKLLIARVFISLKFRSLHSLSNIFVITNTQQRSAFNARQQRHREKLSELWVEVCETKKNQKIDGKHYSSLHPTPVKIFYSLSNWIVWINLLQRRQAERRDRHACDGSVWFSVRHSEWTFDYW